MMYVDGEALVRNFVSFNTAGKEVGNSKSTLKMTDKDTIELQLENEIESDIILEHTIVAKRFEI